MKEKIKKLINKLIDGVNKLMDKIMEKLNKLSLPAVILIASIILGGFFYASQVNKQRSIERQQQVKIDQEKREQLETAIKEKLAKAEAEQALNTCIATAEESYSNNWFRECKAQGRATNRCIAIKELTFDEYVKKYNISILDEKDKKLEAMLTFFKEQNECSCSLPLDIADRKNKSLQNDKDECFKKYPQK